MRTAGSCPSRARRWTVLGCSPRSSPTCTSESNGSKVWVVISGTAPEVLAVLLDSAPERRSILWRRGRHIPAVIRLLLVQQPGYTVFQNSIGSADVAVTTVVQISDNVRVHAS